MKRPSLSQIMAAFLIAEKAHSTLSDFFPSYADSAHQTIKKIKKKLGLSSSLYDKIVHFIGTEDIMEGSLRTDHKIQDGPLWVFMHQNFQPHKVFNIRNSDELFSLLQISELEFIPYSSSTEADATSIILRKFQDRPSCVEKKDDAIGICPTMITMGYHNDRPFVFQLRNDDDDERDFTVIDFIFGEPDKELFQQLIKQMKSFVRQNSPLKNWIISCENDELGSIGFSFDEELCKKLRMKNYKFDIELYNSDVKNLIEKDIKNFIQKQKKFCEEGYDGRRAYLLEGPPGTGKSDIIRSIMSTVPENYTTIILNDKNMYELRNLKRMKFLFPALIVIEDIDLLLGAKGKWQILLNFLDGFHAPDQLITIMTSNNKNSLISSITNRPGRIDRIVHIGAGDEHQRIAQLKSLTKGIKLPDNVTLESLAKRTEKHTVAQLRELIRRALIYSEETDNSINIDSLTTVLDEFDRERYTKTAEKLNQDEEKLQELDEPDAMEARTISAKHFIRKFGLNKH